MIEQRTLEWHRLRAGMITASEFHNLMKTHKEDIPMTQQEIDDYVSMHPKAKNIPTTKKVEMPFSDASYTYLNRKVMERYIPKDGTLDEYLEIHNVSNRAMQYGTDFESLARNRYAEMTGFEVFEVEFIPVPGFEGFCGVSSDGVVRQERGVIEVKCPFFIEHHLEYMMLESADDLLALRPEYYWQTRLNTLAWDCDWCDFISFNPYVSKSKQMKVLRIHRDASVDEQMTQRLRLARDYMASMIEKINKTNMFIK